MGLIVGNWKRLLGAGVLCWLLVALAPAHAIEDSEQGSYAEMSDLQLTEALKRWSSLASSDRRSLLVEIKRRMEEPQKPQSIAPTADKQVRGFTIHIRMQQSRQFGVKLQAQASDVRTGGVLVIRGEFSASGKQSTDMRSLQMSPPSSNGELQPLPGPGFGRGFTERQAFLRAAYSEGSAEVIDASKLTSASNAAESPTEEVVD